MQPTSRHRNGLAAIIALVLTAAAFATTTVGSADGAEAELGTADTAQTELAQNEPTQTKAAASRHDRDDDVRPKATTTSTSSTTAPTTTAAPPSTRRTTAPAGSIRRTTTTPPAQTPPAQTRPTPTTTTAPPTTPTVDASCESTMAQLVNKARSREGLPPLIVGANMVGVPRNWSSHMATTGELAHNPNREEEVGRIVRWSYLAENVGYGSGLSRSTDSVFTTFMNSTEHRDNILSTRPRYMAIGCVRAGQYLWVTQNFWNT